MKQVTRGINLYVNAYKTEFMSLNQDSTISSLNFKHLKLVYQFPYLGSHISSTKISVNISIPKAAADID